MRVTLRKNTWNLVKVDLGSKVRGEIDPATYKGKEIRISTRLKSKPEILEVLLHECLHGCFWDLEEAAIDQAARDIAKVLHKLGARIDV